MNEPQLSAEIPETDLISTDSPTHSVHLSREEYEAKIRKDEREKVLSEVEDWINQLPDWQWRVTREALVAKLNQLKENV